MHFPSERADRKLENERLFDNDIARCWFDEDENGK